MAEHCTCYSAIFPVILRGEPGRQEVLLHLRQNTGYMDGRWDFAGSGHVEDEHATQALVRECAEEIGITVDAADARFAHLANRLGREGLRTYYDMYFLIERFEGIPVINEPDKCAELRWFPLTALPDNMIPLRRLALEYILKGIPYSECMNEHDKGGTNA